MLRRLGCVAAIALVAACSTEGQPNAAPPDLPDQTLLASSMRDRPVPGWTVAAPDVDLPPGTVMQPVGNIGGRGIFEGIDEADWSLFGLDLTSGERLFGPIPLGRTDDSTAYRCFVNGPPLVLCIFQPPGSGMPSTVRGIDTDSGEVVFEGPANVQVTDEGGRPRVEQIGDYVIASVMGEGIHGVGSQGELTWFVPGNGILAPQFALWERDTVASTLAVQEGVGGADVVFSVVDGRIVNPQLPERSRLWRAMVYPGGFGYEYTAEDGQDSVAFFDEAGARLSELAQEGSLETRSPDVPIVVTQTNDRIMTLRGRTLVELPPTVPDVEARLIGSRLFVASDPAHREWRQFDLHSGEHGRTCETSSLGFSYIGSDGRVAVALADDSPARAVDLTTCQTLWSIPGSGSGEAREVWKVGDALIQRTNDKLFSLVAPS